MAALGSGGGFRPRAVHSANEWPQVERQRAAGKRACGRRHGVLPKFLQCGRGGVNPAHGLSFGYARGGCWIGTGKLLLWGARELQQQATPRHGRQRAPAALPPSSA